MLDELTPQELVEVLRPYGVSLDKNKRFSIPFDGLSAWLEKAMPGCRFVVEQVLTLNGHTLTRNDDETLIPIVITTCAVTASVMAPDGTVLARAVSKPYDMYAEQDASDWLAELQEDAWRKALGTLGIGESVLERLMSSGELGEVADFVAGSDVEPEPEPDEGDGYGNEELPAASVSEEEGDIVESLRNEAMALWSEYAELKPSDAGRTFVSFLRQFGASASTIDALDETSLRKIIKRLEQSIRMETPEM